MHKITFIMSEETKRRFDQDVLPRLAPGADESDAFAWLVRNASVIGHRIGIEAGRQQSPTTESTTLP